MSSQHQWFQALVRPLEGVDQGEGVDGFPFEVFVDEGEGFVQVYVGRVEISCAAVESYAV